MFETVTVDQAISRGRRMITFPIMFILLGVIGVSVWLSSIGVIPGIGIVGGIILAIALTWFYWSITITKWRLWAFDNVRNVHELQQKAEQAQLIWPDGGFFERSEIRNTDQKQKWDELREKFNVKDVYQEDHTLPDETVIRYSRANLGINILFGVAMIGVAIYFFIKSGSLIAWVFAVGGLFILIVSIRKVLDKSPQLILNTKGIETENDGFFPWSDISSDQVIRRQQGKSSVIYLEFDDSYGTTKQVNIDELDVNRKALEDMLHTYRIRSGKKNNPVSETVID
jgi:hypothetical protein